MRPVSARICHRMSNGQNKRKHTLCVATWPNCLCSTASLSWTRANVYTLCMLYAVCCVCVHYNNRSWASCGDNRVIVIFIKIVLGHRNGLSGARCITPIRESALNPPSSALFYRTMEFYSLKLYVRCARHFHRVWSRVWKNWKSERIEIDDVKWQNVGITAIFFFFHENVNNKLMYFDGIMMWVMMVMLTDSIGHIQQTQITTQIE